MCNLAGLLYGFISWFDIKEYEIKVLKGLRLTMCKMIAVMGNYIKYIVLKTHDNTPGAC